MLYRGLILVGLVLVGGCGLVDGLQRRYSDFLSPELSLVSVQALPAEGLEQRFLVGLRVRNPNPMRIAVDGMSVRLELNDFPVLSGVSNQVPALPAYGEMTTSLTLGSNLVNSLRLLAGLLAEKSEAIDYRLEARVAVDQPKRRRLTLTHKGTIPLTADALPSAGQ